VKGTANTLERVDIKPVRAAVAGANEYMNTMKIERSFIKNENEGKINW
jgi:primary-amine oxidase